MTAEHEINLGGAKLSWTDERVELLKKLWTEGLSASQIAGRLGSGVTRNAVIGKVHRLNLSGRVQQQRSTQHQRTVQHAAFAPCCTKCFRGWSIAPQHPHHAAPAALQHQGSPL